MKTKLPASINSEEEAKSFLSELYNNQESFHPEDSAHDFVGIFFTEEEATQVENLINQIYDLKEKFDPCEFLLSLDLP
jgi:hypothetical protein